MKEELPGWQETVAGFGMAALLFAIIAALSDRSHSRLISIGIVILYAALFYFLDRRGKSNEREFPSAIWKRHPGNLIAGSILLVWALLPGPYALRPVAVRAFLATTVYMVSAIPDAKSAETAQQASKDAEQVAQEEDSAKAELTAGERVRRLLVENEAYLSLLAQKIAEERELRRTDMDSTQARNEVKALLGSNDAFYVELHKTLRLPDYLSVGDLAVDTFFHRDARKLNLSLYDVRPDRFGRTVRRDRRVASIVYDSLKQHLDGLKTFRVRRST